MKADNFTQYSATPRTAAESHQLAADYRDQLAQRRSVRMFSERAVSKETIEHIIMTASSAPSGAHKQPWTWAAISSAELKAQIREAAEKEEYTNYHGRMSDDWLEDLKKFDTNWVKEFITTAPWIVVLFKKAYDVGPDDEKLKNYYVNESVGIAAGFFISAVHNAGLVTLTHTPSPMNFLEKILDRPKNERAFLLLPVGYPADDAVVPVLERKSADEVIVYYE